MSWILNLKKVMSGDYDLKLAGTINMDWLDGQRREVLKADPLQVSLGAQVHGDVIVVEGPCSSQVQYMCSRCLDIFSEPFKFHFHEEFTQEAISDDEMDPEVDVIFVKDDQVDLRPYIEEQVQVELPFVPLCKQDCRGLCPECGQNLNEKTCECKHERIDPRLAGLKDFFKDD